MNDRGFYTSRGGCGRLLGWHGLVAFAKTFPVTSLAVSLLPLP